MLLLGAAILQHGDIYFFSLKPNWMLAILGAIIFVNPDFMANMNFLLFGALLVKSEHFVEPEIAIIIAVGCALMLLRKYVRHDTPLILFGGAAASASFLFAGYYPFWFLEVIIDVALMYVVFRVLRSLDHVSPSKV